MIGLVLGGLRVNAVLGFVVVVLVAFGGVAGAQPWAQGVTDAQRAEAQKRLEEGNTLFLAQKYKGALEKYQAAVASWDHPAIRFNIVRCLIQLDRPVEASDNLQLALKYGADPLEAEVYSEALSYQKLLANQIADVEIGCAEAGAKVTLDGQALMTCPGKEKRRVVPGQHGIVATKEGFLPKQIEIVVVGGKLETVDVKLVPLATAAKIEHRWPAWIPWVVFGGGLAVAGVGGLVEGFAVGKMDAFDKQIQRDCGVNGCDLSLPQYEQLRGQKADAERLDKVGITVISVGAVTAVAGGVMLFMNRGRTVYDTSVEKRGPSAVSVVPMRDGGGVLVLSGRF